jgi:hypothetical protein
VPLRWTSSFTLTLTGQVVPRRSGYIVFLGDITSSPSSRSGRTSFPIRALRWSTAPWPTAWRRRAGFVWCLWSYTTLCHGPLWSIATILALFTSPPTPSNISAPSILRLIFTLSASALSSETFVSSTFRRLPNSSTSSPRGCPPRFSQSLVQSQHLQWLEFRVRRGVRV